MMFSEILSIIIADSVIDDDEKVFVNKVSEGLEIPKETSEGIVEACTSIMNAYNKLNKLINI